MGESKYLILIVAPSGERKVVSPESELNCFKDAEKYAYKLVRTRKAKKAIVKGPEREDFIVERKTVEQVRSDVSRFRKVPSLDPDLWKGLEDEVLEKYKGERFTYFAPKHQGRSGFSMRQPQPGEWGGGPTQDDGRHDDWCVFRRMPPRLHDDRVSRGTVTYLVIRERESGVTWKRGRKDVDVSRARKIKEANKPSDTKKAVEAKKARKAKKSQEAKQGSKSRVAQEAKIAMMAKITKMAEEAKKIEKSSNSKKSSDLTWVGHWKMLKNAPAFNGHNSVVEKKLRKHFGAEFVKTFLTILTIENQPGDRPYQELATWVAKWTIAVVFVKRYDGELFDKWMRRLASVSKKETRKCEALVDYLEETGEFDSDEFVAWVKTYFKRRSIEDERVEDRQEKQNKEEKVKENDTEANSLLGMWKQLANSDAEYFEDKALEETLWEYLGDSQVAWELVPSSSESVSDIGEMRIWLARWSIAVDLVQGSEERLPASWKDKLLETPKGVIQECRELATHLESACPPIYSRSVEVIEEQGKKQRELEVQDSASDLYKRFRKESLIRIWQRLREGKVTEPREVVSFALRERLSITSKSWYGLMKQAAHEEQRSHWLVPDGDLSAWLVGASMLVEFQSHASRIFGAAPELSDEVPDHQKQECSLLCKYLRGDGLAYYVGLADEVQQIFQLGEVEGTPQEAFDGATTFRFQEATKLKLAGGLLAKGEWGAVSGLLERNSEAPSLWAAKEGSFQIAWSLLMIGSTLGEEITNGLDSSRNSSERKTLERKCREIQDTFEKLEKKEERLAVIVGGEDYFDAIKLGLKKVRSIRQQWLKKVSPQLRAYQLVIEECSQSSDSHEIAIYLKEIESDLGFDFPNEQEFEFQLRHCGDAKVEVLNVGGRTHNNNGPITIKAGASIEVQFRLYAQSYQNAPVEVYSPSSAGRIRSARSETFFEVGRETWTEIWLRLFEEPDSVADVEKFIDELPERLGLSLAEKYLSDIGQVASSSDENWEGRVDELSRLIVSWALEIEYVDDLQRLPVSSELGWTTDVDDEIVGDCKDLAQHLRDFFADYYGAVADDTSMRLIDEIDQCVPGDLGEVDTFRFEERCILDGALAALEQEEWSDAWRWSKNRNRETSFWIQREPIRENSWALIRAMAQVGTLIEEIEKHIVEDREAAIFERDFPDKVNELNTVFETLQNRRKSLLMPRIPEFSRVLRCLNRLGEMFEQIKQKLDNNLGTGGADRGIESEKSLGDDEIETMEHGPENVGLETESTQSENLPENVQAFFGYLEEFGSITEADAMNLLGSSRRLRRFAQEIEEYARCFDFEVKVEQTTQGKRYVRK